MPLEDNYQISNSANYCEKDKGECRCSADKMDLFTSSTYCINDQYTSGVNCYNKYSR